MPTLTALAFDPHQGAPGARELRGRPPGSRPALAKAHTGSLEGQRPPGALARAPIANLPSKKPRLGSREPNAGFPLSGWRGSHL